MKHAKPLSRKQKREVKVASSVNKVIIVGRLGKDPHVAYTQAGAAVTNLSVATDEGFVKDGKKVERTEWHKVVCFGKVAEFAGKYLHKGRLIYVEGSLFTEKWQDKDGNDRFTTKIKSFSVQALDKPKSAGGGNDSTEAPANNNQPGDDDGAPF